MFGRADGVGASIFSGITYRSRLGDELSNRADLRASGPRPNPKRDGRRSHGVLEIEPLGVTVEGRANLVAYKQKDAAGRNGRYRRYWNGSLLLERTGADTIRGRCYFHGFNGTPGELPHFADAGVYEDTIVRVGDTWKFARRHLAIDGRASAVSAGVPPVR